MNNHAKFAAVLSLTGAGLLIAGPAQAASDSAAFGQHVQMHAQGEMGFSGEHNPGMHHGKSGWDPEHTHNMTP
jgi:hypothetical protein